MSNRTISNENMNDALDWLRDNAPVIGKAKARAIRADHMIKHIEALMFKASDAKTADAKKADARTSERYVAAIEEDAEACGDLAKLYALREAAALKIEAWRSEQANYRSMKI